MDDSPEIKKLIADRDAKAEQIAELRRERVGARAREFSALKAREEAEKWRDAALILDKSILRLHRILGENWVYIDHQTTIDLAEGEIKSLRCELTAATKRAEEAERELVVERARPNVCHPSELDVRWQDAAKVWNEERLQRQSLEKQLAAATKQSEEQAARIAELEHELEAEEIEHKKETTRARAGEERIAELEGALGELIRAGQSYMSYHAKKFYDGLILPEGINPALNKARAVLSRRGEGK